MLKAQQLCTDYAKMLICCCRLMLPCTTVDMVASAGDYHHADPSPLLFLHFWLDAFLAYDI